MGDAMRWIEFEIEMIIDNKSGLTMVNMRTEENIKENVFLI